MHLPVLMEENHHLGEIFTSFISAYLLVCLAFPSLFQRLNRLTRVKAREHLRTSDPKARNSNKFHNDIQKYRDVLYSFILNFRDFASLKFALPTEEHTVFSSCSVCSWLSRNLFFFF
jgi:hypothetical protein